MFLFFFNFSSFSISYSCWLVLFWEGQKKEFRFKSTFRLARRVRQTNPQSLALLSPSLHPTPHHPHTHSTPPSTHTHSTPPSPPPPPLLPPSSQTHTTSSPFEAPPFWWFFFFWRTWLDRAVSGFQSLLLSWPSQKSSTISEHILVVSDNMLGLLRAVLKQEPQSPTCVSYV